MKAVVSRSMDPEAVARSLFNGKPKKEWRFTKETKLAVQSVENSKSGK